MSIDKKLSTILNYITSDKEKSDYINHQYPIFVRNSQRQKKKVYTKQQHVEFALLPSGYMLETKLNIAQLNIIDIIPDNDISWQYINLYYDVQQFGIQFIYSSIHDIPNDVYWALRFIKQKLNEIEYNRYKTDDNKSKKGHHSSVQKGE